MSTGRRLLHLEVTYLLIHPDIPAQDTRMLSIALRECKAYEEQSKVTEINAAWPIISCKSSGIAAEDQTRRIVQLCSGRTHSLPFTISGKVIVIVCMFCIIQSDCLVLVYLECLFASPQVLLQYSIFWNIKDIQTYLSPHRLQLNLFEVNIISFGC